MTLRSHARSERRSSVLLIVGSAIFVFLGAAIFFVGGEVMGLLAVLFFGGCLITGVMILVGTETRAGKILAILGCLGMGGGCLTLGILSLSGAPLGPRGHPAVAVPIGLIGGIFFGGGGILLLVRLVRGPRRR